MIVHLGTITGPELGGCDWREVGVIGGWGPTLGECLISKEGVQA